MKVLDHGLVRLVDHMGDDLSIARSARVVGSDELFRDDHKALAQLLGYLWSHDQTNAFEAVEFQFEIKAPAFVFLEWHGHQAWCFTEAPTRYCSLPKEFYLPEPEVVLTYPSSEDHRNSPLTFSIDLQKRQAEDMRLHCSAALTLGQRLLDEGWRPELVHGMMPLSAYRQMFGKVDLINLFRFLKLRYEDETQYELRIYAEAMRDLVRDIVPIALATYEVASGIGKPTP